MSAALQDETVVESTETPSLPLGRRLELPGRGTTFVREVEGPPGAPTVILLHGWIASGGLNWFRAFAPLSEHFRIVAPDLRGHARGIRTRRRFRLSDCADDVAALCEELEIDSAIFCGYSMGGPVSLLMWQRHRPLVDGLVLAATSYNVVPGVRDQIIFVGGMAAVAGSTRIGQLMTRAIPTRSLRHLRASDGGPVRPDTFRQWAAAEVGRHDFRHIIEAGQAIGTFNARRWVHLVDVPTTVLITKRDRGIHPSAQLNLAMKIPDVEVQLLDEGHAAPAVPAFGDAITGACRDVAIRLD